MSLAYRVKRLVKSDMHALVEGLEDPKWVLAQALRDMEEELEKMESDLVVRRTQIDKIKDRVIASEAIASALENDVDFAMQEKREDIARNLIRKLIVTRKTLDDLSKRSKVCAEELVGLEQDYRLKKGAYEDIKGRCEILNLRRIDDDAFQAATRLVSQEGGTDGTLEHQVEIEFLRRLQKRKEEGHE
ncbi:MAG TPA: PspA/IM30 family protein [bacterium]|nr:PspA/IM30 family protein [bacterium]